MRFIRNPIAVPGVIFVLMLMVAGAAEAMIFGDIGNKPVTDGNWRAGSVELANLKSRVGWWEGPPFGGGEHHFLYRGDTAAFSEALAAFAKIRAPELEIYLHDGPYEDFWLKIPRNELQNGKAPKVDPRVDWIFQTWNPRSWHQIYNDPNSLFMVDQPNFRKPVAAPRLDVYVGGGGIEWDKVKVPAGIRVVDARAASNGLDPADGSVVRGSVYDMATGKPLGGAMIRISKYNDNRTWEQTASDAADVDGRFEIKKIPAGSYRIVVTAKGYAPRMIGYEQFGKSDLRKHDVELSPAATLAGRLIDTAGKPIAGMKISANRPLAIDGRGYTMPEYASATTDEQGRFEFTGLPTGFTYLSLEGQDYYRSFMEKLFKIPTKEITLTAAATGTVKGVVIGKKGRPAANAQVSIRPEGGDVIGSWGGAMNVQADGSFQFKGVPPGRYIVTTQMDPDRKPAEPTAKLVTVDPSGSVEVELAVP